jgi:hypothetical protein
MSKMILKNSAGASFIITGLSAGAIVKLDGVKGEIGETSIKKLLKQGGNVKGWHLVQEAASVAVVIPPLAHVVAAAKAAGVKRANRQGVEFQGLNVKRMRNPMTIKATLTQAGQAWVQRLQETDSRSFYREFLEAGGGEYTDIAHKLGWSRERVAIEVARAVNLGHMTKQRQSNPIVKGVAQGAGNHV